MYTRLHPGPPASLPPLGNKLRHGLIDLTEYLRGMTDYELLVLAASFEDMCHTVDGPESSRTRSELIDLLLKKYQQVQF